MASLENHSAALSDVLIPNLDFKMGNGSSYVQARTNLSIYPQGSNIYSYSSGTKVVRINVNTGEFIDPASAFLFFKVSNVDTTAQTATAITKCEPLGQAHVFFSNARLLMQGQVLEEISDFGRNFELLMRLSDPQYQKAMAAMSFGLQDSDPETLSDLRSVRRIPAGASKTVAMPLSIFGTFGQHRFIPTNLANIVIELQIADPSLVCRSGTSVDGSVTTTFNSQIELSAFVLKVDGITLDSQLMEEYNKMALTRSIPLSIKTWHSTSYSQSGQASDVSIAYQRQLSRLCTVFVHFFSPSGSPNTLKEVNYFPHVEGQLDSLGDTGHPFATTDVTPDEKAITYEFTVDGKRFPSTPINTTVEAYTALVRALGFAGQTSHSLGVGGRYYETSNFVICENFEKILSSELSGLSLRGGSALLLHLKGLVKSGMAETDKITKISLLVQYSAIAELSASGVTILE